MMENKTCVFCNTKDSFKDEQILYKGKYFYLVVPKGQIVDGFLIIAPYSCDISNGGIISLSTASNEVFNELKALIKHIKKFYKYSYNIDSFSYYEQGRGAEGKIRDDLNDFPIHSHVCTLPSTYNFQEYMKNNYNEVLLNQLEDINKVKTHYLLLSTCGNIERICAYTGKNQEQIEELSHFRFKKIIADLLNCHEKEQWRMCSEIDEKIINDTIKKYNEFIKHNESLK